jgi:hypothetical protein
MLFLAAAAVVCAALSGPLSYVGEGVLHTLSASDHVGEKGKTWDFTADAVLPTKVPSVATCTLRYLT